MSRQPHRGEHLVVSLYFVYLRPPETLSDRRDDPLWEFGSFGKTGCHKNLVHSRATRLVEGDRLAFLQGYNGEVLIVGVSPPISVGGSTDRPELKWDSKYRPLPFSSAPFLITNAGATDFPRAKSLLNGARRPTFCGKAASKFRSTTTEVDLGLTNQVREYFAVDNLPKIKAYPEAIQPQSGRWYRNAMSRGWATLSARTKAYERAG